MNVEIREATLADLETIAAFNQAMAFETEGKRLDPQVAFEGVRAVLTDATRGRYFVAASQERVIGQLMITYEWSDWRNGFFWWIQSVYVHPDYRRQGAFRTLYEHVRQRAMADRNTCGLRLYAHSTNLTGASAYKRLGMEQTPYVLFEEEWTPEQTQ
jgi:GNAT superfamily N-acetyltransferase